MYQAILFDLDGTLLDTAPDLGFALNEMRRVRGLVPLPLELIRPQASHGSQGLLQLGFGVSSQDPEFAPLRQEFLDRYEDHLVEDTRLFDGVADMLAGLEAQNLPWGVVTNKPARYTEPLLARLGLASRMACIVSGDTAGKPKPHPEPLWHACQTVGVQPGHCLYVGDAERDIQAASAAGMAALVALYGYLSQDDRPDTWGAQGHLASPMALLDYLEQGA